MKRRTNIINNIIFLAITLALFFTAVFYCSENYKGAIADYIIYFIIGVILSGFLCTLFHELGHVIFGKCNNFAFLSMSAWFFCWTKEKNKIKFKWVLPLNSAGHTEMVAKDTENLSARFKKYTAGGLYPTFILMLLGITSFITNMPSWLFCIISMFLPIGAYSFFGTLLPMMDGNVKNDGAILCDLKNKTDSSVVLLSILSIQSQLYNGKTPSEIDQKYYFDVPQLIESDLNFALILDARYCYYLDKGDYENAKKVTSRLLSLEEYLSKEYMLVFKTNALYNACTFDFNENLADDLMYELEKYLNNVNTATNVRTKLAYILYISRTSDNLNIFYNKGVKEAKKEHLQGLKLYEQKLLDKLKLDFDKIKE